MKFLANFGNFKGDRNKNPTFCITLMHVLCCEYITLDSYIFVVYVTYFSTQMCSDYILVRSHVISSVKSPKKSSKFREFKGG